MYFRFANNEFIYLLGLIPILILIYIYFEFRRKKLLKKIGDIGLIHNLTPNYSKFLERFKFIILLLVIIFLIIAMARPQYGKKLREIKRKGLEIIIALDISNSMRAEDIKPSRIERAKQAILKFIDNLNGDKIGIIVFAGDAYMQVPITIDYNAVKIFVSQINPDIVSRQGTAIGSAIELAQKSYNYHEENDKVLIIISDGENHEGNTIEAAKEAAKKGIIIYCIGMGTTEGTTIPIYSGGKQVDYLRDKEGHIVVTRLNPQILIDIASIGKGKYYQATNHTTGLEKIIKDLENLNRKTLETKVYSEYEEQFPFYLSVALILLIMEILLTERKINFKSKYLK